ncbi:MBL fold metallo-hydrolase [Candidatus Aminicenantes bacterium AH-873-B07]|jgi:glyoxylase-like metal-dependent hydrolase (beta-lactamase superfamily II)|nr:MBL fold metallo-hydrolase [Candidatus Aminicenantes bacterium AH-873-B07]
MKSRKCFVIDPGAEGKRIISFIKEKNLKPIGIINTHGHIDHIGANRLIKKEFNIPIMIHSEDSSLLTAKQNLILSFFLSSNPSPPADDFLEEAQKIKIGDSFLEVIHTPGHTPGSISLKSEEFLLSGDTLFAGGVGRTDLSGGSWELLLQSIKNKLFCLPDNLIVLPGHGDLTTIKDEKETNPFVHEF